MKTKQLFIVILLWSIYSVMSAQVCNEAILIDNFTFNEPLPEGWTEVNTSGQVTVDNGWLKFDFTGDLPSAYRSYTPVSTDATLSFDVYSTRNYVKCRLDLLSSDDKYLGSIMMGNDDAQNIQYATAVSDSTPTTFTGALLEGTYASNTTYSISVAIDFDNHTLDFYQGGTLKASDISFLESAEDIAKISITQLSMYSSEGRFFFDNLVLDSSAETLTDEFGEESIGEWEEFNTDGQVRVSNGALVFDYSSDLPSAYREFTAVNEEVLVSFDVYSSRNYVKCRFDILSSDGDYVTSVMMGNNAEKNIQYATSLDASGTPTSFSGALLDGAYASNTVYSIDVLIDFENSTLTFFQNGDLKASDVAFVESADDIAKLSITQLAMYSSEGQFYFDNVSVAYPGMDRSVLAINLAKVDDLTYEPVFSELYGSTEEAYDALIIEETAANIMYYNCDATQAEIDSVNAELEAAIIDYENAFVNEDVVTLYSGSQLDGESQAYKCGYYNGTLGDFEDQAVSFHLEKGYMLTVAQDVNGAGVSKVYIASEDDLRLNFPAELQKTISFMRVGPWRDTKKRGASGKSNDVALGLKASWFYDWGSADTNRVDCEYVVMDWSGGATAATMEAKGSRMAITHHLAFNEPDGANQANMTTDKAIAKYEILQASGLRLGAPAVTDGAKGRAWLDEFMDKADSAGYRIDFIPVHYYKTKSASGFYTWLKDFYDEYQLPIWVTEFNYGDIWENSNLTEANGLSKTADYCEMMDTASFIERYCYFTWQPSQTDGHTLMSSRYPVVWNTIGEYYSTHDSPVAYVQDDYENGPNYVGVSASLADASLDVYPNPVSNGELRLDYSADCLGKQLIVKLFDMHGQLVVEAYNTPQSIDVSALSDGIYLIRIDGEGLNYSKKLMIKAN